MDTNQLTEPMRFVPVFAFRKCSKCPFFPDSFYYAIKHWLGRKYIWLNGYGLLARSRAGLYHDFSTLPWILKRGDVRRYYVGTWVHFWGPWIPLQLSIIRRWIGRSWIEKCRHGMTTRESRERKERRKKLDTNAESIIMNEPMFSGFLLGIFFPMTIAMPKQMIILFFLVC
ncbi:uncharacterized protein BYT42DRAFT_325064 [Radiomyces spectabilis]|uniref:uncharacterized protein n=1 Tax=Radiomyces spectabilis TaxID=64574 RepID=UPI00221F66DC|nr:uncharacterized protein BYT42DRAFT_325064 [Radiomyces spectabilis]KAI8379393.1 hypothetical protein BYT42DRAFT_325064 [Radiomyces spectabilis]